MKVMFNADKCPGNYKCRALTPGKVYEVEDVFDDYPNWCGEGAITAYLLAKDDHEEQVPYDAQIFDIASLATA
ncbi:MAG: hypothetical protein FWC70_07665 [Defluviitaleaceae bacterium]|nr:hypothetical protein [Defluviitaleaceae bacterium]